MRALFFSLFLLFWVSAFSQQTKKLDSLFQIQIFGGVEYYQTQYEGQALDGVARPALGIGLVKKTKGNLSYSWGFQYFHRGAKYTPAIRLEERGFEFLAGPKYQIGDFALFLNGVFSSASTKEFSSRMESEYGVPIDEISNSNLRLQMGAEVRLMPKTAFFYSRTAVFDDDNSHINQFGIRYTFGPRKGISGRRKRRVAASRHIQELKDGVLLVRLQNPTASIQALKENGQQNKAYLLEYRISEQNSLLMGAFASDYDFSKVYFFYSQHSDSVREGNFKGILYDQYFNQIKETSFIDNSHVFTAEFGEIGDDSLKYFDHLDHEGGHGAFTNKARSFYYKGGSINSFDAIVISDQKFNKLSKPFPYYSRWGMPGIEQHWEQAIFFGPLVLLWDDNVGISVKRLNRKLHDFYIKYTE